MELFNRPASDYETSAWLCGLIGCFRSNPPEAALTAYAFREFGLLEWTTFMPAADNGPAWFAWTMGNRGYLVIDGATSIAQLAGCVDGYTGVLQSGFNDPYNGYIQDAATRIVARLVGTFGRTQSRWTVAGYSLGGAIASLLPFYNPAKPQNSPAVEVVTFGAPRPGGATVCRGISAQLSLVRWMTANDPVPLIPIHTNEMSTLPLIIGVRPALRWQNFLHPAGGMQINQDGTHDGRVLPTEAASHMSLSLANWWWSFYSGNATDHSLTTYQTRLQAADARRAPAVVPGRSHSEASIVVTHREVRAAERSTQQQLVAIERRNNQVVEIIPKVERFKHVKIGRAHYVTFRGTVVSTGTDKRNALGICREMNAALHRLQRQAVVDTLALGKEFTEYLAEASDVNGEFSPVMNTTIS